MGKRKLNAKKEKQSDAKPGMLDPKRIAELLKATDFDDVHGDLEQVVFRIAGTSPDLAADFLTLMLLLQKAEDTDAQDILLTAMINYAYPYTEHHGNSLQQFKNELFRQDFTIVG